MSEFSTKAPKPTPADVAQPWIRAGLSAIPLAGAAATALFESIIAAPLSDRRDRWVEDLAAALHETQERLGGLEGQLRDPELFLTVAMQASSIAMKTHETVKRTALRNAVINAAAGRNPDPKHTMLLLAWLDELTEWHLVLLAYFNDPPGWFASTGKAAPTYGAAGRSAALQVAFPELDREFYDQIVRDLFGRGLVSVEGLHVTVSGRSVYDALTTNLGRELVNLCAGVPEND